MSISQHWKGKKMTDQEINVGIAEACGWTHIENRNSMAMGGHWFGYPPVNAIIGKKAPIPDFASDLNAMHEAEKVLPKVKITRYISELWGALCRGGDSDQCEIGIINATARQRAEAFLRTIGKWNE